MKCPTGLTCSEGLLIGEEIRNVSFEGGETPTNTPPGCSKWEVLVYGVNVQKKKKGRRYHTIYLCLLRNRFGYYEMHEKQIINVP